MNETNYFSVHQFAEIVGVSKQAIYKQIRNKNSRLFPYIIYEGKTPMVKGEAITEVYEKVYSGSQPSKPQSKPQSTLKVENSQPCKPESKPDSTPKVEKVDELVNPSQPQSKPESKPLETMVQPSPTDYIDFLKKELEERKQEEVRLNSIIQEKDQLIKEQSQQIALLAQQMAQIATANTKERLLSSIGKNEVVYTDTNQEEKKKGGFWHWLFG